MTAMDLLAKLPHGVLREWPEVGLDYVDETRRLSDYLLLPFRRRASLLGEATTKLDME